MSAVKKRQINNRKALKLKGFRELSLKGYVFGISVR